MRSQRGTLLTPRVIAWRAAHGVIAIGFLTSIGYVWWCALTGRHGPFLRPAVVALLGEGAVVAANHGDCPLGPVGDRIGDPVPLFELVFSPAAARRAIPALGIMAGAGICLLASRSWSRPDGLLPYRRRTRRRHLSQATSASR